MTSPAENLQLPTGALTYSKADFEQTAQRFIEYGVRLLAPKEVAEQLPLYRQSLLPSFGKSAGEGDQSRSMKLKYR